MAKDVALISTCRSAIEHIKAIIELAMCVCIRLSTCVCKSTPITADVTVTKIAGYVRVRILMNR